MPKTRAKRNRTIEVTASERKQLLKECLNSRTLKATEDLTDCIIRGDSFKLMKQIKAGTADLIVADPPYNLTKTYSGKNFRKQQESEYEEYTKNWLELAWPLLKDGGSMYVCCDWQSSLIIGRVLGELPDAVIRNRITWQREKGRGAAANWKNGMEDIWFVTKGESYTFNLDAVKMRRRVLAPYKENGQPKDWVEQEGGEKYRDTCPSNFWDDITIPFWSMPENTDHPTQKPEKLIAKLILASSNEGDLVFDPFLGSGTTAVVAKKLERKYLGIEESEEYCALAVKRLGLAQEDRDIQGFSEGVFWERHSKELNR